MNLPYKQERLLPATLVDLQDAVARCHGDETLERKTRDYFEMRQRNGGLTKGEMLDHCERHILQVGSSRTRKAPQPEKGAEATIGENLLKAACCIGVIAFLFLEILLPIHDFLFNY